VKEQEALQNKIQDSLEKAHDLITKQNQLFENRKKISESVFEKRMADHQKRLNEQQKHTGLNLRLDPLAKGLAEKNQQHTHNIPNT